MACGSVSFRPLSSPRIPMASSPSVLSPPSSPASSFSAASVPPLKIRASRAAVPMPPLNPRDPFLAKLASAAAASPDPLALASSPDSDTPPYLHLFESPKSMSYPAQVERSVSYNKHRRRSPPPDLPSILLDGRIVYIGMPLVPVVTELVIAELIYLQWEDPKQPIYLYINSTGTTRADGETVARDAEGFAIYDAIMQLKIQVETVAVGTAVGQACLLLAAGKKGRRFMLPHAKAVIVQPKVPPSGQMSAIDVLIHANEVIHNRDTFVELLAKHTGQSEDTLLKVMRGPFYMNPVKAKEFGVIDKILWQGQENLMADTLGMIDKQESK